MVYTVKQHELPHPAKLRLATGEEFGFLLSKRETAHINGCWSLGADELLICKPGQAMELEFMGGRTPLSVLWLRLSTDTMAQCSTEETDVIASFLVNPAPIAVVRTRSQTLMLLKNLTMQLMTLQKNEFRFAADMVERATIQMFLGHILRACVLEDPYWTGTNHKRDNRLPLDDVFAYIHAHLTEELTLELLEQEFYVSRHHLIREFKKRTGQTVHRYIVKARLDLCRRYIEQGYSISEVYRMGGFGGYNHFFRAFRQTYGMTPKAYYRAYRQSDPEGNGRP